jgi:hypothetical protein
MSSPPPPDPHPRAPDPRALNPERVGDRLSCSWWILCVDRSSCARRLVRERRRSGFLRCRSRVPREPGAQPAPQSALSSDPPYMPYARSLFCCCGARRPLTHLRSAPIGARRHPALSACGASQGFDPSAGTRRAAWHGSSSPHGHSDRRGRSVLSRDLVGRFRTRRVSPMHSARPCALGWRED